MKQEEEIKRLKTDIISQEEEKKKVDDDLAKALKSLKKQKKSMLI